MELASAFLPEPCSGAGCVPQGPTSEVRAVPPASLACLVSITGQVLCDVPTGQLLVLSLQLTSSLWGDPLSPSSDCPLELASLPPLSE